MTNHKFTPTATVRSKCDVCGKTRNAQAHRAASQKPVKAAPAPGATPEPEKTVQPVVKLWVGWRVAHAAILRVGDADPAVDSLAVKLRDRTPDAVMDRYVKLTRAECAALDSIAAEFEAAGNIGPVIYSARTLRKRIVAAWA
jgi:hypothetical protein